MRSTIGSTVLSRHSQNPFTVTYNEVMLRRKEREREEEKGAYKDYIPLKWVLVRSLNVFGSQGTRPSYEIANLVARATESA